MLRKLATAPARSLSRLLLRTVRLDDPWRRVACPVPLHRYGTGARHDFAWYLEGQSRVEVGSIREICRWLRACEYVRDGDLFYEADYWQHPCAFEQLRQGDCEDFALWAWRKLIRLGHTAEFVAGFSRTGAVERGHAWVHFEADGTWYLLDEIPRSDRGKIDRRSVRGLCEARQPINLAAMLRRADHEDAGE